jgi:hypothetical protein
VPLPDVVAMQTRQSNLEGTGEIRLRRLVKEALRMRPSRIVVGEVRQEECLDLLIALNSGLPESSSTATAVVTLPACDLRERKASRSAERNRRRFELRIPAELRTTAVAVLIGSWLRSPRGWRWWTGHGRPPGHPPGEEHPGSCGNLGEQVGLRVAHVELVAQTRDGRAQQVAVPTPAQARH